jgi:hypothetical protein
MDTSGEVKRGGEAVEQWSVGVSECCGTKSNHPPLHYSITPTLQSSLALIWSGGRSAALRAAATLESAVSRDFEDDDENEDEDDAARHI